MSTIPKIAKSDPSTIFSIKVANQIQITGNFFLSSKTILEMFSSYLGFKKIYSLMTTPGTPFWHVLSIGINVSHIRTFYFEFFRFSYLFR